MGWKETRPPPAKPLKVPQSRSERLFFFAGLAAIVALAVALVPTYHSYHSSSGASPEIIAPSEATGAQGAAYRPPAANRSARLLGPPAPDERTHATQQTAPTASAESRLALAAPRGDCWVEVRAGSATGKILYVGTLKKGNSFKLVVSKLWIRFGAPQNVDLALNGKPVSLPAGSLNVLVTAGGVTATT